jgi:hypothetical protein
MGGKGRRKTKKEKIEKKKDHVLAIELVDKSIV